MNISDRTINALQFRVANFQQSEFAELEYTINWDAVLNTDTIATSSWKSSGALTITPTNTDKTATAKVKGNPGIYLLTNKITTASGITDERQIKLQININDRDTFSEYV